MNSATPWRSHRWLQCGNRWRSTAIFAAVFLALLALLNWSGNTQDALRHVLESTNAALGSPHEPSSDWKPHPIDDLVARADQDFKSIYLLKQANDLETAAVAYRARRGRHPPPHFDKWYRFAKQQNAVVIEEYFDQIYHDLNPYWAVSPPRLRYAAKDGRFIISSRNGQLIVKEPEGEANGWTPLWVKMMEGIPDLPDFDVIINPMDESRVLVPWEEINALIQEADITKHTRPPSAAYAIVSEYSSLRNASELPEDSSAAPQAKFESAPFWNFYRPTCPPGSPGHSAPLDSNYSIPANFSLTFPYGTHEGYVSNSTIARDPCLHPNLRNILGPFVSPLSIATTTTLYPIFGGSKLPGNNDILLPAPIYFTDNNRFAFKKNPDKAWDLKESKVVWRGTASGGRHNPRNWLRFQRQRFMSLTNATQVSSAEKQSTPSTADWKVAQDDPAGTHAANFVLPRPDIYHIPSLSAGGLGHWFESFTDTGFMDLACDPRGQCQYLDPYFEKANFLSLADQFGYKYLPDIDGNSFSGRYRAFLLSASLPIKATVFSEWHDSRLTAWRHYVPMDNSFIDFWGIMSYFMGWKDAKTSEAGRDDIAKKIALQGKEWAELVLRREDMEVYVYRLLLEWARICDDRRVDMGWVDDLSR